LAWKRRKGEKQKTAQPKQAAKVERAKWEFFFGKKGKEGRPRQKNLKLTKGGNTKKQQRGKTVNAAGKMIGGGELRPTVGIGERVQPGEIEYRATTPKNHLTTRKDAQKD